jgi:hypothetical protein
MGFWRGVFGGRFGAFWGYLKVELRGMFLEKIGKKCGYCKAELKGDKKSYFKVKTTSYNYKKI